MDVSEALIGQMEYTGPQLRHGNFSRLLHSAQIQSALRAKWWVLIGVVKSSGALQAELSAGYCYKRFWKSSISVAYYHWAWIWHLGMANAPGSSPGRVVRERSGFLSPLGHRAFDLLQKCCLWHCRTCVVCRRHVWLSKMARINRASP